MTQNGSIEFEYRQRKVIARAVDAGWELKIISRNGGGSDFRRLSPRGLSDVIDSAKRIIDYDLDGRR